MGSGDDANFLLCPSSNGNGSFVVYKPDNSDSRYHLEGCKNIRIAVL